MENPQVHAFADFPFDHFPKSKIDSESRFEEFWSILKKKSKNGFPIVFSKKWFGLGRVLFLAEKNSEKAKHPSICPSFGGNMPESQFWQVPFKAPPTSHAM